MKDEVMTDHVSFKSFHDELLFLKRTQTEFIHGFMLDILIGTVCTHK